ncbi:hypothetical protein [Paractinoplanes maris]|uniref:hypothetical protein n=1 Tax=Paractinoplanes maris TaxID=1734446 RepID=UPI00202242F3|nr:hypothetical protein [Actinoplanes maris]
MTTVATRISSPTRGRRRAGGWVLVAAELGFVALYAVGLSLSLARAAELAGHWHIPEQGDAFTAELDILGGWTWAFLAVPVVTSGFMVAVVGLLVSLVVLLSGYAKGHRRLIGALVASTATMVLLLIVTLTPAAMSVSGWLLD